MAQMNAINFKNSWSSKQKGRRVWPCVTSILFIPHPFAPEVHENLRIPTSVPKFEVKLMVFQSDLNKLLWKDS